MNDQIKVLGSNEQAVIDRYPDWVNIDEREGYVGLLVDPANLLTLMSCLRDDLGYDHLTSVTGVDYFPEDIMEVVYHIFRSTGGAILEIKTQVSRSNPEVPSLYDLYPGADFQEREAWDLLGIKFAGHPNLKRILMWEGFAGHPLRKDYVFPMEYHGIPAVTEYEQTRPVH